MKYVSHVMHTGETGQVARYLFTINNPKLSKKIDKSI